MIHVLYGSNEHHRWSIQASLSKPELERIATEARKVAQAYLTRCREEGTKPTETGLQDVLGDWDPADKDDRLGADEGVSLSYYVLDLSEPRCGRSDSEQERYLQAREHFERWWGNPVPEPLAPLAVNDLIMASLGVYVAACFHVVGGRR